MKTLDFNEMEKVEGGINCAEIAAVLDYLLVYNPEQFEVIMNMSAVIQCTE